MISGWVQKATEHRGQYSICFGCEKYETVKITDMKTR